MSLQAWHAQPPPSAAALSAELGHNFGSSHTHGAPTAVEPACLSASLAALAPPAAPLPCRAANSSLYYQPSHPPCTHAAADFCGNKAWGDPNPIDYCIPTDNDCEQPWVGVLPQCTGPVTAFGGGPGTM